MGTGLVRSIESASLLVLRAIEEEGIKQRAAEISITVAGNIALYILNQKRSTLIEIEGRYGFAVRVQADDSLIAPEHRIERLRPKAPGTELPAPTMPATMAVIDIEDDIDEEEEVEETTPAKRENAGGSAGGAEGGEPRRKRRRNRRRRGGRSEDGQPGEFRSQSEGDETEPTAEAVPSEAAGDEPQHEVAEQSEEIASEGTAVAADHGETETAETAEEANARRRRRGRRGGRGRTRRGDDDTLSPSDEQAAADAVAEEPAAAAEPAADTVAAESPEPEPAPAPEAGPVAAEPEPIAEIAAEQPVEPEPAPESPTPKAPVAREYEIVNEPPPQPKRGFWKRLVE
jgi:ribonuclease E